MTTLWSATCQDPDDNIRVVVRVEAANGGRYDLHIRYPPPPRALDLPPIDVLLRDLDWDDVLTWFDRYRLRTGWSPEAPPSSAPRRPRRGHNRAARAERPRRTFARTQPWGRPLAPLPCGA